MSDSDTVGMMIQYENQTAKVGFMMCNCGKHYGDRCEEGCERQRETLEKMNTHLRSAMENMLKSLDYMRRRVREQELKLPGLTGEPWRK